MSHKFKAMEFKVDSVEQSERLQSVLFKLGYVWASGGAKVQFTGSNYLHTGANGWDPKHITRCERSLQKPEKYESMNTEQFIRDNTEPKKLNRKHGIEVGSKVKVLNAEGSSAYIPYIGKILTVSEIKPYYYDEDCDLITCEGIDCSQHPSRFELIPEQQPNGVDADGEPVYFDASMFEQFMRVENANGAQYIIVGAEGKFVATNSNGDHYSSYDLQNAMKGYDSKYMQDLNFNAVYAAPVIRQAINESAKGKLLWKRDDSLAKKAAERKEAEQAIHDAEMAMQEAQAKLQQAKAKMQAL